MTLNNDAWQKIFEDYNILDCVYLNGVFKITSEQINKYRQSRLMAKFDTIKSIPDVFSKNSLSILPTSRGSYVIGKFKTHQALEKSEFSENNSHFYDFPNYKTLNPYNISSESNAINLAYASNIISDVMDDENIVLTVSGRMSTGNFSFEIDDIYDKDSKYLIDVQSSQCEIDAAFEGDNKILLIEAKNNFKTSSFITRQLYYPYRLLSAKSEKTIIPALMFFCNEIFEFYTFEFQDINSYSSIKESQYKQYILKESSDHITSDDILNIFQQSSTSEPLVSNTPFPQADSVERTIGLLNLLHKENTLTKQDIVDEYQFDERQSDYYTNSCIYFDLVEKVTGSDRSKFYRLTSIGESLFEVDSQHRYLKVVQQVFSRQVFRDAFDLSWQLADIPDKENIFSIIKRYCPNLGDETISRRSTTVSNWIWWIINLYQHSD